MWEGTTGKPGRSRVRSIFRRVVCRRSEATYDDVIPATSIDKRIVVIKQSIGVVAALTPWNFPFALTTRKVAPALAAGSPVIVKPPSETPLTGLAIACLAEKAGFPPGVYNTVTTTDNSGVGKEFCENRKVRKLQLPALQQ